MTAKRWRGYCLFLLTPLREGRLAGYADSIVPIHFYSRPCGRGDMGELANAYKYLRISTHAPAGGATRANCKRRSPPSYFYSRPCGRGDTIGPQRAILYCYFYSRPCGRGDAATWQKDLDKALFLLTPLREGRQITEEGT